MKIGILAIQGDFDAHRKRLEELGAETVLVKTAGDLEGLDGLVLPGGESTTHMKLLAEEGLLAPLQERARAGMAIFGTCAGAILLAKEVKNPAQESLALVDMTVIRNAYGRQLESRVTSAPTAISDRPLEMVFIRAPVIERAGEGVEILARRDGSPVLVRQGRILAATFHPELSADPAVHAYFLKMVRDGR
jgi:pyridoxal 5'-phosphate synthase pdxT subunit